MHPKQRALWLIGQQSGQTDKPFSSINDAISCCNEIIKVFDEYHPPLTSNYWREVKKELEILNKTA